MRLHKRLKQNKSLLPSNSTLLLAVSGGQDSMALLKLITDLKKLYNWQIEIWHGDHQWHRKSEKIENELKLWCLNKQISFHSNQANKEEASNEEKARNWRYQNLIMKAKLLSSENINFPCQRILTGHTATDRAETIIMNLARGSDLIGLSTLKEQRVLDKNLNLARPFLIFNRRETLEICKEFNLPIWIDPSNTNINLTRNRIRNEILPILNSIYKGADSRIAYVANRLESYSEDQQSFAKIAIEFCKGEHINSLSRKKLIDFTNSIRKIILSNWLKMLGVKRITALQIEEINNKISRNKPPGTIHLHGDFLVSWDKENINVSNKTN
ncbi:tRNA lysidine(34) synthetase TilS [Prochlorococcus marinus]|uniref:tRNA(Ile)-lysidine synthase n=1 Tax=Prochlorococcus marinus XMU1408 TaxID=2213228 RepID=A0A318RBP6_PROMR|nr:tRNA lysidine(34) synthetase TilS [Prochlorococcus marinus]MBW3042900.1 tRNA lysidine(34) synthetase TilS [Prochlorococcus marinus str. XMU1408]PYE00332.1 tRNA lysidine(34) synthetase TilS [Prochlorococcus marinus XMU1408]